MKRASLPNLAVIQDKHPAASRLSRERNACVVPRQTENHYFVMRIPSPTGKFNHSTVIMIVTYLLIFSSPPIAPAAERQMSPVDCIALAIQQNRTIRNAYLDRIVQRYDLRVAEDKFTPKLYLTPSVTATGGKSAATTAVTDLSGYISEQLPLNRRKSWLSKTGPTISPPS